MVKAIKADQGRRLEVGNLGLKLQGIEGLGRWVCCRGHSPTCKRLHQARCISSVVRVIFSKGLRGLKGPRPKSKTPVVEGPSEVHALQSFVLFGTRKVGDSGGVCFHLRPHGRSQQYIVTGTREPSKHRWCRCKTPSPASLAKINMKPVRIPHSS